MKQKFSFKKFISISYFILGSFLIFLGVSCTKDFRDNDYYKNEIFDEEYMGIYGEWRLIESGGGISGDFQADFDKLLIYEIGNYKKMRNDTILIKGIIEIREQTPYKLNIDFVPLYAIPTSSKWVKFIGNDTLKLDDTCTDCNYHIFVRE